MTATTLAVLAATDLEDDDLLGAGLGDDRRRDLGARHGGAAELERRAIAEGEDVGEDHGLAERAGVLAVVEQTLNVEDIALFDAILLATGTNDCVHVFLECSAGEGRSLDPQATNLTLAEMASGSGVVADGGGIVKVSPEAGGRRERGCRARIVADSVDGAARRCLLAPQQPEPAGTPRLPPDDAKRIPMSKPPVRVAVTGAAGQIAYSLLFRIASGDLLGKDQPVILHLIDLPPFLDAARGVVMEIEDCAFPTYAGSVVTADAAEGFGDVNVALLVGAKPRGPGMERADLLKDNGKIFIEQGDAIDQNAHPDVKVLVVGNPCNTNCLIAASRAKRTNPRNYTAMTRLDQNRAVGQLANRTGAMPGDVRNIAIWGNHSPTMFPNYYEATIGGKKVTEVITDEAWLKGDFISRVQKRGAEVINARGKSSAASAANAAIDHIYSWATGSVPGDYTSMAVVSDGSYGIPEGLVFSYPVKITAPWKYEIVQGQQLNEHALAAIKVTTDELLGERDAVKEMIGG